MGERGYTETLVMVAALAIMVIAATVIAVANLNAHNPFVVAPTPTPSPSTVESPDSPAASPDQTAQYTAGQAFGQVKSFYGLYQSDPSSAMSDLDNTLASQVAADGASAVYCNDQIPSAISYDPPQSPDSNDADITAHFTDSSGSTVSALLTVDLSDLLITQISCQ